MEEYYKKVANFKKKIEENGYYYSNIKTKERKPFLDKFNPQFKKGSYKSLISSETEQNYNKSKINLKKYAKIIVDNYRNEILNVYKTIGINSKQLRLGGNFSFKRSDFRDPTKFDEIVNSRDKYLWYGLVYKITESLPNNIKENAIGGFTTNSMRNRWNNYIFKAVLQQGQGGKLHKLIYDYLYEYGFEKLKINGIFNWRLIFGLLESRFTRTPMEIHFSSNSLRLGEINFIESNDLIDSGLNTRTGGGGGRDKIDLPMIQIAYFIALGHMETEIYKFLKDKGYQCSVNTIRRRISEFWGSFEEAQIRFLRPVFYMLLTDGFQLYEINDAFDRFTINYIETMFGSIPYKELIKTIKMEKEIILKLPIIKKLDGWEGKPEVRFDADFLIKLIINYNTMNKAIKVNKNQLDFQNYDFKYYRFALMRQIHNQLGSLTWEDTRKTYVLPRIINDFRSNQLFENIYQKYGWSISSAHYHNRISSTLFFGMRSIQVRQFLMENPSIDSYDKFEEIFLTVKDKLQKDISIGILNSLILKHVDIDNAQIELNSMGYCIYNFINAVEKIYGSWENAFKTIKIPYIINTLRRGLNPIEIYQNVGYSKNSTINHNSISKRLFFGADTESVLLFLEMNPDILTLEDFRIRYERGYLKKLDSIN